jgi:hypothetical protein
MGTEHSEPLFRPDNAEFGFLRRNQYFLKTSRHSATAVTKTRSENFCDQVFKIAKNARFVE